MTTPHKSVPRKGALPRLVPPPHPSPAKKVPPARRGDAPGARVLHNPACGIHRAVPRVLWRA